MRIQTILLPLVVAVAACVAEEPVIDTSLGQATFQDNCAACHGAGGRGDGPAADGTGTPPADLTRIAARRGGVWPMLEVMSIVDGYTKTTEPRPGMPVIPALTEGPRVIFDTGNGQTTTVPESLLAVTRYLETIQDPPPLRQVP
ncbi:Cytochrome C oxidase, cbb3-type, subunit III [Roseivivax marinus]|uniref:c-type cytochrome n=1 Tax=Roseivivax marinus TaxID=1379903 RepID=UPI0008D1861E|nr:cytochrome c [Roseivivax marinus]SEL70125.1 Cytochrome C oxidase, cbb3-type, subunit III [Roseivivax marinus]